MTLGQFNSIVSFFVHTVPSREAFKKLEDQFFKSIEKIHGISKADFVKELSKKLTDLSWKHGLTDEQLVELANRVNSYPVYLAVAKKLPIETVRQEFPSLEKKLNVEQVGTSFTSTANIATYPVPIGKRMLRRKRP